jgi:serine/threonine-protein kinase HipA
VEVLKLFRLLVFGWWSGNGDMHLKNFSLLIDTHGIIRLSPAYDLVCTRLVIPQDPLALPVCGKKDNLNRKIWIQFADYCQLSPKAANRVLDKLAQSLTAAQELIDRSFLPTDMKLAYRLLIAERTAMLQAA